MTAALLDWTITFAVMLLLAFLGGMIGDLSRVSLTTAYFVGAVLVLVQRRLIQAALSQKIASGNLRFRKICLIGRRTHILNFLLENDLWKHGQQINATLYLDDLPADRKRRQQSVSGFARSVSKSGSEFVVIVGDAVQLDGVEPLLQELKSYSINVVYALSPGMRQLPILDVVPIGPQNTLRLQRKPWATAPFPETPHGRRRGEFGDCLVDPGLPCHRASHQAR